MASQEAKSFTATIAVFKDFEYLYPDANTVTISPKMCQWKFTQHHTKPSFFRLTLDEDPSKTLGSNLELADTCVDTQDSYFELVRCEQNVVFVVERDDKTLVLQVGEDKKPHMAIITSKNTFSKEAQFQLTTIKTDSFHYFQLAILKIQDKLTIKEQTINIRSINDNPDLCRLSVIVGVNGSGKTNLLRVLSEVWRSKNDTGVFFWVFFDCTDIPLRLTSSMVTNFFANSNIKEMNAHFNKRNIVGNMLSSKGKTDDGQSDMIFIEYVIARHIETMNRGWVKKYKQSFTPIKKKLFEWTGWYLNIYLYPPKHMETFKNTTERYGLKYLPILVVSKKDCNNFEILLNDTRDEQQICQTFKENGYFLLNMVESAVEELLWFFNSIYSEEYSTIFLDEPDRTFHTKFVHKMLGEISQLAPSKSVILISHALEIVNWCYPTNLLKAIKQEEKTSFRGIGKQSFHLIDKPYINELFFTEKVILVEGKDDYLLIKTLQKLIEENLKKDGYHQLKPITEYHVIPVNGKENMPTYKDMSKKLNTKAKIILDRDAAFIKEKANQQNNSNEDGVYTWSAKSVVGKIIGEEKKEEISLSFNKVSRKTGIEKHHFDLLKIIHQKARNKNVFFWLFVQEIEDLVRLINNNPQNVDENITLLVENIPHLAEKILNVYLGNDKNDFEENIGKDEPIIITRINVIKDFVDFLINN